MEELIYKHGPTLILALIGILQIVGFGNETPLRMDASTLTDFETYVLYLY